MCCFIDSQDQHGTSVTTIKILLILYNIIFWVCGFGLIWFGVRLKIEMHIILMLIDAEYKEYLPFLIFYIGIILVFIVSLAFTCLIKIQKSMLFINCLADLEMIINKIFMELTVTISCIALFSLLGSGLNIGLSKMYHAVDYELML